MKMRSKMTGMTLLINSEDIRLQTLTSFSITWVKITRACGLLAEELSSRSNPLRTDEFPTRFSASVDTRISFKL